MRVYEENVFGFQMKGDPLDVLDEDFLSFNLWSHEKTLKNEGIRKLPPTPFENRGKMMGMMNGGRTMMNNYLKNDGLKSEVSSVKNDDLGNGRMKMVPPPVHGNFGRMNPQMLRMQVMRGGLFVDPTLVCNDPFFSPKKSTYTSVFVRSMKNEKSGGEESLGMQLGMMGESGKDGREWEGDGKSCGSDTASINLDKEENVEYRQVIQSPSVKDSEYDLVKDEEVGKIEVLEENRSLKRKIEDVEDSPNGFKLPVSKSPIMEAMSYCAIMGWGIELEECKDDPPTVIFKVTDFDKYYRYSSEICSKQNPTEDIGARVKSLKRWFTNFPKKKDRKDNPQFSLEVKQDVAKKVYNMVEKYRCMVNVRKIRRMK